jgi:hypothetical protein
VNRLWWFVLLGGCGRLAFDPVSQTADCGAFALADREVNLSSYAML